MRLSDALAEPVARLGDVDRARFHDWLAHPLGERVYRLSLDDLRATGPTGLCRTLVENDPGGVVLAGTTQSARRTLMDAGAQGNALEQAEHWTCMPGRLIALLDDANTLDPDCMAPARLRRLQLPPARCLVMSRAVATGPGRLVARGTPLAARASRP